MAYDVFIDELKGIIEDAKELFNARDRDNDERFRAWRQRLSALINEIENRGYDIDCNIDGRSFDPSAPYGPPIPLKEKIEFYNMELQDTVNELETIIELFNKFGDPKGTVNTQNKTEELKWPSTITLAWLRNHAPVGLWLKFGGILFAVFIAGVALGQSRLYSTLLNLWQPQEEQTPTTKEPNKSSNLTGTNNVPPS